MKKIVSVAIILLAGIAAFAQDFQGTFSQTKTMKVSGLSQKSKGKISFQAPDRLKMDYTNPEGDYFFIFGDRLIMDMRGITLDVDTSKNGSVRPQRNALIYGINGEYEKIADEMNADCTVTSDSDGKHVVLKARKVSPKSYTGMQLHYNKAGRIVRLVLEEFGGILTEYVLNVK